jgi:hypothetical protein
MIFQQYRLPHAALDSRVAVLVAFTGYAEPAVAPTNTERNTAILAMLAHYPLNTINTN